MLVIPSIYGVTNRNNGTADFLGSPCQNQINTTLKKWAFRKNWAKSPKIERI